MTFEKLLQLFNPLKRAINFKDIGELRAPQSFAKSIELHNISPYANFANSPQF